VVLPGQLEQADQAALVLPLVTCQAARVILVVVASAEMLCRLIRLMDVPVHQAAVARYQLLALKQAAEAGGCKI
jgi:hypothetical protein